MHGYMYVCYNYYYSIIISYNLIYISDVNDAELRLLVFDAETRLSFSEKKRARAELRLLQNITEPK